MAERTNDKLGVDLKAAGEFAKAKDDLGPVRR
jgi:hypothetical protein